MQEGVTAEVYPGQGPGRAWYWRVLNDKGEVIASDPRPAVNAKTAEARFHAFRACLCTSSDLPLYVRTKK